MQATHTEMQLKMGGEVTSPKGNSNALRPTQLVANPKRHELDKLSNPTDYFNIYKQKVQEIAE